MAHAIVSLISVAVMVTGVLAVASSSCSSVDLVSGSWGQMAEQTREMARTRISFAGREVGVQGINVEIILTNTGRMALGDFPRWDVVVEYYGGNQRVYCIKWLPYSEGVPGDNEWTVHGIYLDAQTGEPEVFEPGILNPGEEIVIQLRLSPKVWTNTTNRLLVATSNGVAAPVIFTR